MQYWLNKGLNYKYKITQNTFSKYLTDFQTINFEGKEQIVLLDYISPTILQTRG